MRISQSRDTSLVNLPQTPDAEPIAPHSKGQRRTAVYLFLLGAFFLVEVVFAIVRAVQGDWVLFAGSTIGVVLVGTVFWYLYQERKKGHAS